MNKGKWEKVHGSLLTEKAYGACSICGKLAELPTSAYALSIDVTGLNKCPHCNSDMEFYFHNFY
jgi:DNA-directed RNA polymerase subunit RPC12/RpoP